MEPDDLQKLYQTYVSATADDYYKVVSWSDNNGARHNVAVGRDGKVDLSSIPTRDLLNECYRRRAIEKFSGSISIDSYMLNAHPEAKEYALRDLSRELWDSVVTNSKFYGDAMSIKESNVTSYMRTDFTGEIYICKHPTKVRK